MNNAEIEALYKYVPEKRVVHTMGVEKSSILISSRHYPELDEEILRIAAVLHDVTKYCTRSEHEEICERHSVVLDEIDLNSVRVLHQITGALRARELGAPEASCGAIRWHTTGKAEMNEYEKTLMLADYIEPSRTYDGVETIRDCYHRLESLGDPYPVEKTLIVALNSTIMEVLERGEVIHPDSIKARNYLISVYDKDNPERNK